MQSPLNLHMYLKSAYQFLPKKYKKVYQNIDWEAVGSLD